MADYFLTFPGEGDKEVRVDFTGPKGLKAGTPKFWRHAINHVKRNATGYERSVMLIAMRDFLTQGGHKNLAKHTTESVGSAVKAQAKSFKSELLNPIATNIKAAAGGVNQGIVNTLNAPGDILGLGLDAVGANGDFVRGGGNTIYGAAGLRQGRDYGTGEAFRRAQGIPDNTVNQVLGWAGQGVGESILPSAGLTVAARTMRPASAVGKALLNPIRRAPGATAVAGGAFGGGQRAAREGAVAAGVEPWIADTALAALPLGIYGGAKVGGAAAKTASPFFARGRQQIVGNVLRRAGEGGNLVPEAPPIPGMTPTLGQSTNNKGILALERMFGGGAGVTGNTMAGARATSNQAIDDVVTGRMAGDLGHRSRAVQGAVAAAREKVKNNADAAWAQFRKTLGRRAFPVGPLKARINKYVGGLREADKLHVPKEYTNILTRAANDPAKPGIVYSAGRPKATIDFDEVDAVRSNLLRDIRAAARNPEMANKARVMKGIVATIDKWSRSVAPADGRQAYAAARGTTRYQKTRFDSNKTLGPVLKKDASDDYVIAPDAAANRVIMTEGKGALRSADDLRIAAETNPDIIPAVRRFLTAKFAKAISGRGEEPSFSPTQAVKFMREHEAYMPMLGEDARALMNRVTKAAQMLQRSADARGSPTYQNIKGQLFIDNAVGKLIGAGVMDPVRGPVARMFMNATAERIENLLVDALADPNLARALMMRATPENSRRVLAIIGPYLRGAAGNKAADAALPASGGVDPDGAADDN